MTRLEENKLLADFIGLDYNYTVCDNCDKKNPESFPNGLTKCCSTYDPEHKNAFYQTWDENGKKVYSIGKVSRHFTLKEEDLCFDSDWNELMKVVSKLWEVTDMDDIRDLSLFLVGADIENGFEECVELVELFNFYQEEVKKENS